MCKLFEDMSFSEKLDHIEKCQEQAIKEIKNGSPSQLADIADHVDIWGPWMLGELRKYGPISNKSLDELAIEISESYERCYFSRDENQECECHEILVNALKEAEKRGEGDFGSTGG